MVARNIRLPNIRKMFVPDPGYLIVDADLSGADAQVVAWEAGDEDLKTAFRNGAKIHVHNSRTMYPRETKDMPDDDVKKLRQYKEVKAGVHATNYGASPNALVTNIGWDLDFARRFQSRWFELHPAIREWHLRFQRHLNGTQCWNCDDLDVTLGRPCNSCGAHLGRTVKNAFGFREIFFDRVDGELLPKALAWTPQSTVAFCTDLGWINLARGHDWHNQIGFAEFQVESWEDWLVCPDAHSKWGNVVQFLLQVHDSIVFQVPREYEEDIPQIVNDMLVRVPYKDPLIIPMGFKYSSKSWGDCE